MATYAPVAYTTAANNTQIDFDITFTFLRNQDLAVSVIDPSGNVLVAGTGYDTQLQTQSDGTFDMRVVQAGTLTTTNTPLTAGHVISIKRSTDISTILTVFQDGASFKAADINAIINQLFNNAQETAASVGEGIVLTDDLAAFDANNKPLRNLAAPTADTDAVRKIDVDSGIGADITTVAGIASDITTVVSNASNINAVAGDAADIGTVAGSIANVNSVGGAIANVNAVAGDAADIGTVAGISSAVSSVAGISSAVSAVAGVTSDVTTLAPQASNISTLTQTANLTALQNAATNAAAAEAALNAFNRTYLGAYASDPTVDNNGDALTDGDLYFNSTSNNLKFYDAGNSQWITLNNAVQVNSAATLQGVGDVDFAYAGGITLGANNFIVRDGSNTRWENTDAAGVRNLLNVEDGATADQTGSDIKNALFAEADTNNLSDTLLSNLQNAPTISDATNRGHVEAINQALATTDAPEFAGADFGSNAITYSNKYDNLADLPDANTYHGMFAHVHATGRGYFAHGGNWIALAHQSEVAAKQDAITTSSGTVNAQALTTQVGNHAGGNVSVDVRKANVKYSTSNLTAEPGASLVNMDGAALTLTLPSTLAAGDIITVYANPSTTGPVKIIQGAGGPSLRINGETSDVANPTTTGVSVGNASIAVITMAGSSLAIISGSDLT